MSTYDFAKEISFDDVEADDGNFELLPLGWYRVAINGAEYKQTSDGRGHLFKTRFDVVGPTHAGRVLFDQIFCQSEDPSKQKGVKIGLKRFKALMTCLGKERPPQSDEELHALIGREIEIKVGVEKARDGYEARNNVRAMRRLPNGTAASPTAAPAFDDADLPF